MSYEPPLPNSSRLIDWGHSWVAPPQGPYASSNIAGFATAYASYTPFLTDKNQWPTALRDALGIGSQGYTVVYSVPARTHGTATQNTFLDFIPADCTVDSIYYVPQGSITGANTNTAGIACYLDNYFETHPFNQVNFVSGVNGVQGTPVRVFGINDIVGINSAPSTPYAGTPYTPAIRGVAESAQQVGVGIWWSSIQVGTGGGTGQNDPGGQVIIRYGTRYRNYGVSGATLLSQLGPSAGNWCTAFCWSPWSRPNAIEVNFTGSGSIGSGVTVNCTTLDFPIPSGAVINFKNGATAGTMTLTSPAVFDGSSVTGNIAGANIVAGLQGHVQNGTITNGEYESLSPTGINVWSHGVNDAGAAIQDVPAWLEACRAVIAKNLCPSWNFPWRGNWSYTNGGGTWTAAPTALGGCALPYTCDPITAYAPATWTGTVSGSPSATINIGPAFEGGTLDLFLIAAAGSSLGVAGSITVDGTTPPQGSVTFNTSGVSTSGLLTTSLGSVSTSGNSASVTGTGFAADLAGQVFTCSGGTITTAPPAGTIITSVSSSTQIVLSASVNVSGTTGTAHGYVPMVKRITGLSAGAHTITITITGSDSTANSVLMVYGIGVESQNPTTPVIWNNIARLPIQTTTTMANSVYLNAASYGVINGPVTYQNCTTSGASITVPVGTTAVPTGLVNTNMTCTGTGLSGSVAVTNYVPSTGTVVLASGTPSSGGTFTFTNNVLSGNTAEPALPTNVQYVDIDTLFAPGGNPIPGYFFDGIHFNSKGHRVMARTLFTVIRNNFTPDQLISR